MSKADLRLDWCSYQAAKYAVEHWHYSKTMPASKRIQIGVWEYGKFIGAIIFAMGATPVLLNPYGLKNFEGCELVRVALTKHESPVSRILSIAIKMLKHQSPGLRLIVSFADPLHGHNGGIYQAGGWVFTGITAAVKTWEIDGVAVHRRAYVGINYNKPKMKLPTRAKVIEFPAKYRYLYPLDPAMRAQIEPLRKPYPKRGSGEIDSAAHSNVQTGGASPTDPLLNENGKEQDKTKQGADTHSEQRVKARKTSGKSRQSQAV